MAFLGLEKTNEVFCTLESLADIPLTDQIAWEMYPKHAWLYSASRLLDLQNVKWQPFYDENHPAALDEFTITDDAGKQTICQDKIVATVGKIFIAPLAGETMTTNVVV